jgi:hypothetical protein
MVCAVGTQTMGGGEWWSVRTQTTEGELKSIFEIQLKKKRNDAFRSIALLIKLHYISQPVLTGSLMYWSESGMPFAFMVS